MNMASEIESPNKQERLLRLVRRFCRQETCAALQFDTFVNEIGDRESAESALKELWRMGFVVPTGTETDPEDGALFEIPTPNIEDPIRDSSQFVLTDLGYKAVDSLYDPYADHLASEKTPELYVPKSIIAATEFINQQLMEELKKIQRVASKYDVPQEVLLVMDATTGQNGLAQARHFTEAVGVSGIFLAKLDGTAKGGIVLAICDELNIPIAYL